MKYAIQVHGGPGQTPSAHTAYQFIKAALAEGHEIVRIFFYLDGVQQGFGPGGTDAPRLFPDWPGLAGAHGLDLVLCVSAATRRGLLPPEENDWPESPAIAPGFRAGGLGQWMEACLKADRVVVFGG
ncbi:sulfurtransferase complex subunit TusD [Methylomagnum ishizawai]|uniref:sulfurtransferase complex subunit TusD n=1 Tax=Methylomagnum ishizawai TaxID=1760988 RepID=UPI001C3309BB|nr:sulfurtransferase complex subunit TusD [Methylomagnum ishizawai]BBL75765.1 sulfurtransferase TusD [Methylomagnum ishizawai]